MLPVWLLLMAYLGSDLSEGIESPKSVKYGGLASFLSDFGSDSSYAYILTFVDDGKLPTGVLKEISFPFATFELRIPLEESLWEHFTLANLSAPHDFKVLLFNVEYSVYSTFLFYYSELQMNVNLLCGLWFPAEISYRNEAFLSSINASCCQSLFVQSIEKMGAPENHLNSSLLVTNLNVLDDQPIRVSISLNREFETVCVQCGLIRPNLNHSAFEYFAGYEGRNMIVLFIPALSTRITNLAQNMVHFEPKLNKELNRWEPSKGTEAYMADYFERSLNVTLEFRPMDGDSYGKIEEYGLSTFWNGVIGMVYNKTADVGYGEMSMNYNRSNAVQFTSPYTIEVVSFITKKPSLIPGYQALWWPFDTLTWIIVCSSLAACVFTLRLFRASATAQVSRKFSILTAWPDWTMVAGMILKQPGEHFYHPTQLNYRLFLITMWMYTIVITNIYCSAFTSMMSLPVYQDGIDTIADLGRAAIHDRIRCAALADSVMLQCITEPNDQPGLAALAEHVARDPSLVAKSRDEVVLRKHVRDFCFVDMANYLRKAMEALNISDTVTSRDFFLTSPSSYALQKKCYIVEQYSAAVRSMVDSGLVDRYLRQALYGNKTKAKKGATASPLVVEDVKGHFMMLIIGLSSIIAIELLRTAIYVFLFRSSPRRSEVAGALKGYEVKLMNKQEYYRFQTKVMDGTRSPHRSIGRSVYSTGNRSKLRTENVSASNLYIIVLPK